MRELSKRRFTGFPDNITTVEQMFVEAGKPAQERLLPHAGPLQVDKRLALTAPYNVEIVGPSSGHL